MHVAANTRKRVGVGYAVLAAVLFGASTPFSKQLLGNVEPVLLAGILYLGSGIGLTLVLILSRVFRGKIANEASINRTDIPWLAGAVFFGGVVGPVLLLLGLSSTPAGAASLLLNLEGVLTALLAWFVFKENFDGRIAVGMAAITAGGIVLSWSGNATIGVPWGSLGIVGACLAWAIDNNLTRKVSASNPLQIAATKGVVAGTANLVLGLALGSQLPATPILLTAAGLGFLGYGVSLACFVLALRHLGTARTGAYFSLAPFVGAAISLLFFREAFSVTFAAAAALMALGVWLHLTEHHNHEHVHEPMFHDHSHVHDEHHQHEHDDAAPPGEPHSHPHFHPAMTHAHPHFPDIHHRHDH